MTGQAVSIAIQQAAESSSWIRQMFEKGRQLKEEHGPENVYDFSLGNPILEPPEAVHQVLTELIQSPEKGTHRYMPNGGLPEVREYLAGKVSRETGLAHAMQDIVLCVGAGGGLNVFFKSVLNPGEDVLAIEPYFVEYRFYVQNHGGVLKTASSGEGFQLDLAKIEASLTPSTKVVVINSPNNPTGVVYSQESINELGALLSKKEAEFGHPIFLVSDDPYRYLLFDGLTPTHVFWGHKNSVLITSHSKDLGLAGERIGYIALHPEIKERAALQNALVFATRTLGFVNAPALMQRILPRLDGVMIDIQHYQRLRDLFVPKLQAIGYQLAWPQGAFYCFPAAPGGNDITFVKAAQEEKILLVPGTGFGVPGHFRLSYCCTEQELLGALPGFERLYQQFS